MSDICVEAFLPEPINEKVSIQSMFSALADAIHKFLEKLKDVINKIKNKGKINVNRITKKQMKELMSLEVHVNTNLGPQFNDAEQIFLGSANELLKIAEHIASIKREDMSNSDIDDAVKNIVRVVKQYFGITLKTKENVSNYDPDDHYLKFEQMYHINEEEIYKRCMADSSTTFQVGTAEVRNLSSYNGYKNIDPSSISSIENLLNNADHVFNSLREIDDKVLNINKKLEKMNDGHDYDDKTSIVNHMMLGPVCSIYGIVSKLDIDLYGRYYTNLVMWALLPIKDMLRSFEGRDDDQNNEEEEV